MSAARRRRPGRPPRLAEALLRWVLPSRLAEQMLGDLEEEYRRRVPAGRARLWYWSQAVRSIIPAVGMKRAEHNNTRKAKAMESRTMGRTVDRAAAVQEGMGFALRGIRRAPGFTLLVVATLALGLGANATMFSVVDRLLLRPPDHVRQADRVVQVYFSRLSPFTKRQETSPAASYPDFRDLQEVEAFESISGYSNTSLIMGSGTAAERVDVQMASGSLFDTLGVRPGMGRFFAASDDGVEGQRLAVLSHAFWTRRFGRDPDVLGRVLRLGKADYEIVGVAPRGFTGPTLEAVDVWLPLLTAQAVESGSRWQDSRRWYWFRLVARLADGVSAPVAAQAATAAHLRGRADEIARERYDPQAGVVFGSLIPGRGPEPGQEAAVSLWLAGVALLVLVIACANVANLLLTRGIRNRREWAVRQALGISAGRMVGVLLIECLFLALLAGAAAVAVSAWSSSLVYSTLLPHLAPESPLAMPRILLFTGLAAMLATLLAGLIPALQALRIDPARDLRESRAMSATSGRVRSGLLLVQVGMSVVLLVGAGLFLRSLMQLHQLDLGFEPQGVVLASVESEQGAFNDQTAQAVREGMLRLRGAPGVSAVAVSTLTPFRGLWGVSLSRADGQEIEVPHGPYYYVVSADYFKAMGMRIVRGRGFAESDMSASAPPVTVLTQDLAQRAFPGGDALGQCVQVDEPGEELPCTTVVGILADHRSTKIEETESPILYLPMGHPAAANRPQTLVVKASGAAADLIPLVRRTLLDSTPEVRYASVSQASDSIRSQTRSWRLGAVLFTAFGALALVVASLGLYALIAFDVAQKRRELAIRGALGAAGKKLMLGVLRRAFVLTLMGTAVGLAAVYVFGRFLQDLLFRVQALDPLVIGIVAVTLTAVSLAASAAPALRAARVPLAEVLRAE
ncbi:MAG TPA: ADOP family duplicated permease [Acidobacteriota bacterium]|nr:ADOP family duplicated permease [Acidobacteriota bacterium]